MLMLKIHDFFDEKFPQLRLLQLDFIEFEINIRSGPLGALVGADSVQKWVSDRVLERHAEVRIEHQHFV